MTKKQVTAAGGNIFARLRSGGSLVTEPGKNISSGGCLVGFLKGCSLAKRRLEGGSTQSHNYKADDVLAYGRRATLLHRKSDSPGQE
ncbi:hypothetical protein C4J81_18135 [Deltaproteobacteria bacterium Smac51]|nr:hypothetical protein C4J81_18135 [Deltaproteobacteria bacterium Smac51]